MLSSSRRALLCLFTSTLVADAAFVPSAPSRKHGLMVSPLSVSATLENTGAFNQEDVPTKSKSSQVSWDWQQVAESAFNQGDERPIILFDGKCNLCNGGVNFALDHDPSPGTFRFVSLQSKIGQSLLLKHGKHFNDISSIVVCYAEGEAYFQSDAILKISQGLEEFFPLQHLLDHVGFICPKFVRDGLYEVVSENRYRFGESQYEQCRLDLDGEYDSRFLEDP